MIEKFWNRKIGGLLAAGLLIGDAIIKKIRVHLHSFIIKGNLGSVGKNVVLYPGVSFRNPNTVIIGDNVTINRNTDIHNDEIPSGTINISKNVSIGEYCLIDYSGDVFIDENTHIANDVCILTHTHGYDPHSAPIKKSLSIGKNVFIGMKSIILPSVGRIGDNVVVGMGAVVTKDVPDNAIVAGNPARIIKYKEHVI